MPSPVSSDHQTTLFPSINIHIDSPPRVLHHLLTFPLPRIRPPYQIPHWKRFLKHLYLSRWKSCSLVSIFPLLDPSVTFNAITFSWFWFILCLVLLLFLLFLLSLHGLCTILLLALKCKHIICLLQVSFLFHACLSLCNGTYSLGSNYYHITTKDSYLSLPP